jgi:hypothetical protein
MALTNDTGLPQWPKIVRWAESFDPLVRKVRVCVCQCTLVGFCVCVYGWCVPLFRLRNACGVAEMARVCRRLGCSSPRSARAQTARSAAQVLIPEQSHLRVALKRVAPRRYDAQLLTLEQSRKLCQHNIF